MGCIIDDVVKSYSKGLETWGINHATHTRSAVFEVIKTLKKVSFLPAAPATIRCTNSDYQTVYTNNATLFDISNNTASNTKIIQFRKVCIGSDCYTINKFTNGKYTNIDCAIYGKND